jgi:hypothetical protein
LKLNELKQLNKSKSVADLRLKYDGSGNFGCNDSQLTSLAGAPATVSGDFRCFGNQLTSLAGAPSSVGRNFSCNDNRLTSLAGAPSSVGGGFYCGNNALTSLEGSPSSVGGDFFCNNNALTSLVNVHKHIKEVGGAFVCSNNPIKDGLEYLLLIKGVKEVSTPDSSFDKVVNSYLKTNPSGSMKAVLEIMDLL